MEIADDTTRLIEGNCSCVSNEIRVTKSTKLKPGDHITYPVKSWLCQLCLSHHAIVKCSTEEEVTLLHFTRDGFCKKIAKEEPKKLDFQNEAVFKIVYEHPENKGKDVIDHAEKLIGKQECYCMCLNNCEHFCKECVTKKSVSSQTMEFLEWCRFIIVVICLRPIRVAAVFSSTVPDEFNRVFKFNIDDNILLCIEVVTFCIYALTALIAFIYPCCKNKNKKAKCCKKQIKKCALKFIFRCVFCVLTLATIILLARKHAEPKAEICVSSIAFLYGIGLEICLSCSARCRLRCIRPCMCCNCCYRFVLMNSPINEATNSTINAATNSPINNATYSPINNATNSPINDATNSPINDPTNSPINDATNSTINNATNSSKNDANIV